MNSRWRIKKKQFPRDQYNSYRVDAIPGQFRVNLSACRARRYIIHTRCTHCTCVRVTYVNTRNLRVFPSKHVLSRYYRVPFGDTIWKYLNISPLSRTDESLSVRSRSNRIPNHRVPVSRDLRLEEPYDDTLKLSLLWCAMLAAKVAFPVLFLVSLVSEARYHSRLSRVFRSSAWDRPTEEQDWYFEQCRFVNAWKEHLGHVSVLAFLDPAWQYSFRQAVM